MTNHDDSIVLKRKLESTNPPICISEQHQQKRRLPKGITNKIANIPTEEFNYEQYDKEQIQRKQRMRKILQDMVQELPTQKTGEIDEKFGIPKSEVVLIDKIVERHKLKTTLK